MGIVKAIPTEYNGVQFRSRTEARCAVFFDSLGIKWLYEAEGFSLDSTWYVPDFWLPGTQTWIEVKGSLDQMSELDYEKVVKLSVEKPWNSKYVFLLIGHISDATEVELVDGIINKGAHFAGVNVRFNSMLHDEIYLATRDRPRKGTKEHDKFGFYAQSLIGNARDLAGAFRFW